MLKIQFFDLYEDMPLPGADTGLQIVLSNHNHYDISLFLFTNCKFLVHNLFSLCFQK